MAPRHKVELISVPAGRLVADASLSPQKNICCCRFAFATEQSFLGASDEQIRFAAGSQANRCFLRESVSAT